MGVRVGGGLPGPFGWSAGVGSIFSFLGVLLLVGVGAFHMEDKVFLWCSIAVIAVIIAGSVVAVRVLVKNAQTSSRWAQEERAARNRNQPWG